MKSRVQIKHDSGILYVGIDVSKDKLAVHAGDLFEEEIDNTRRAIARMAMLRGAEVTLVSGQTALEPPPFVETVPVVTGSP